MKALVTGATGFIGSHLVERLVKEEHHVKVLIRKHPSKELPEPRNDALEVLQKLQVTFCYGDLLDFTSLQDVVKDVEVVFHLAAIARPMAIPKHLYFDINETGTKNLLEACRTQKKIKKIIIMSSISAVGPTRDEKPVDEKTPRHPIDMYGESKLAQEDVALMYFKKFHLPVVLLRPPMVFGPRDAEMLRLFRSVKKRFFPIHGGKNSKTEFLYVKNLVEACMLAVKKGKLGEIYHISNERSYSFDEITQTIAKAFGVKLLPIHFPHFSFILLGSFLEFLGKIFGFHPFFKHDTVIWMTKPFWYSDISKAKKELGYTAPYTLEQGVKETVQDYQEKGLL